MIQGVFMSLRTVDAGPWYREPWPWILMAGPAAVVVAGIVTMWLAFSSEDGLVADDYYRQGLAINQTLARERTGAEMQIEARIGFSEDNARIRLSLTIGSGTELPRTAQLRLVHPTRAGKDQVVLLQATAPGLYEGRLAAPEAGRWLLSLSDAGQTWRVRGVWRVPDENRVTLTAPAANFR